VSSTHEFIRGLYNVKPVHFGNVVTMGSFDGVHLGHQAIIKQLKSQAERLNLPSMVMIFEPQPHEFFAGDKAPARLMRLGEKIHALFDQGVDRVLCLPFNHSLSSLTAAEFIQQILIDALGVQYLVVGDDFRFGSGRSGSYSDLVEAGEKHNFDVTDTQSFLIDRQRVSSTRIRGLLQENDFDQAAHLLGKPYTISGRVIKGQQLGRQLGAPTANVHLHRYRSPLAGVFAVVVELVSGERVNGVANVGVRPTLGGDDKAILEVHLFDRSDDLYGQNIIVECKHQLRQEKRFENLDALKEQIQADISQARYYFERHA